MAAGSDAQAWTDNGQVSHWIKSERLSDDRVERVAGEVDCGSLVMRNASTKGRDFDVWATGYAPVEAV
jgi:hypothetical protein